MPYYRKKICASPNCKNYAESGSAWCKEHQRNVSRDTTSEWVAFYKSSWWTKARKKFLLSHIWCEECLKEWKHTPSALPHHKFGFNSWETFCDMSKWEAVCKSCHSRIHTQITNEELWNKFHGERNGEEG